jgi:hypothetical protein
MGARRTLNGCGLRKLVEWIETLLKSSEGTNVDVQERQ